MELPEEINYKRLGCEIKLSAKVVKMYFPRYMLTEEGRQAAQECMSRSNMIDAVKRSDGSRELSSVSDRQDRVDREITGADSAREARASSVDLSGEDSLINIPPQFLERCWYLTSFLCSSTSHILAEKEKHVQKEIEHKRSSESLYYSKRLNRMCFLEIMHVQCLSAARSRLPVGDGIWIARHKQLHTEYVLDFIVERKKVDDLCCSVRDNRYRYQKLRLLVSFCSTVKPNQDDLQENGQGLRLEGKEGQEEGTGGWRTSEIETWKREIINNRLTTEILEGFYVLRASGLADTLRKYGYLTLAITKYYESQLPEDKCENTHVCPPFNEFIKRCEDLDKMTVSDVFAIQLMQQWRVEWPMAWAAPWSPTTEFMLADVLWVTEEVAIAVLDFYQTLLSLAHAYSHLKGDVAEAKGATVDSDEETIVHDYGEDTESLANESNSEIVHFEDSKTDTDADSSAAASVDELFAEISDMEWEEGQLSIARAIDEDIILSQIVSGYDQNHWRLSGNQDDPKVKSKGDDFGNFFKEDPG
ncbi:Crossover junction endonuclease mus81 [Ancistrocladus abbreviatus]